MQYVRSYTAFFDSPRWGMNLLAGSVCHLVPFVGPMVWLGYLTEVVFALHRGQAPADFDTGRLMQYLNRGVWPFLVQLIVGLVISLVLGFLALGCMAVGAIAAITARGPGGVAILLACVACVIFLSMLASVPLGLFMYPALFRAAWEGELGGAFSMAFIRDFWGRLRGEALQICLFLAATAYLLLTAGEAVLCVGIYPALALVGFATMHLLWQAYEGYLAAGGEPLAFRELATAGPAGAPAAPQPAKFADPPWVRQTQARQPPRDDDPFQRHE